MKMFYLMDPFVEASDRTNVVLAAFTTAQAHPRDCDVFAFCGTFPFIQARLERFVFRDCNSSSHGCTTTVTADRYVSLLYLCKFLV